MLIKMKYIYGPVNSRRLGLSLGISLTPYKVCSFDCVYCQLGATTHKTSERKEYIKIIDILDEFKLWLANNSSKIKELNYITFSGAGEPTLNIGIGRLIREIRKITTVPIAILTNSAHLKDPALRHALINADLIVPSLDAVTQGIFEKIDRPAKDVKIKDVIEGLINLRKEFPGKIWLEVMLIKGINDDLRQIRKLKEVIDKIDPDIIQLNSPVRKTAFQDISAVDKHKLKKIREILGNKAEII